MSTRISSSVAAALAAIALVVVAGSGASGASPKPTTPDNTVIIGGYTQSVDPTAYNYVPPQQNTAGMVVPMSATGITYISAFNYSWQGLTIPVPSGYITHSIDGSGLTIKSETALYLPSLGAGGIWGVNICNWRIDFQNRSSLDNRIISTQQGGTNAGCSSSVARTDKNFKVKQGSECARLYVNGTFRGEQCHAVF